MLAPLGEHLTATSTYRSWRPRRASVGSSDSRSHRDRRPRPVLLAQEAVGLHPGRPLGRRDHRPLAHESIQARAFPRAQLPVRRDRPALCRSWEIRCSPGVARVSSSSARAGLLVGGRRLARSRPDAELRPRGPNAARGIAYVTLCVTAVKILTGASTGTRSCSGPPRSPRLAA
jgi:hypothetical protein